MSQRDHILNELNAISQAVANVPLSPVFTVPENYFAEFPEKMMEKIRENAKYETELISPLLGGMEKKNPFSVPPGYFAALEETLKKPAEPIEMPSQTPVVRMYKTRRVWNLSVAAMIVGVIGIGTWLFYRQDAAVLAPAQVNQVNINAELPKVSEEEMADFLLSVPDMPQTETLQVAGLDNLNIEDMLKDVQEGELQDYVKDMPELQPQKLN